ncbi:ribonuclease HII [Thermoflavifilum thermophilum]|uniref:Ribonuclease HII n=1 Tax=Thermoflavifilum thermophilum TaxID=1393122 RepID=A0A1I7NB67_9BACT|nr:ribonuclease HII [Thermoflavifilum thermophilum]SFV31899.1 RNase HII [Thermoflavifilum thermophilum]
MNPSSRLLPCYQDEGVEAGCDEAGRGCLAGPVFAAAVILPAGFYHPLLNDSKQLRPSQREELRQYIEKHALSFAVAAVSPEEIDRINILQASFRAMHLAVDQLRIRPQRLLIDGNRFIPYADIPHVCIVKGDSRYAPIAAASILAKTYRDAWMMHLHAQYPEYGWDRNKGYPTTAHRRAIQQLGLTPHHRRTFSPCMPQLFMAADDSQPQES